MSTNTQAQECDPMIKTQQTADSRNENGVATLTEQGTGTDDGPNNDKICDTKVSIRPSDGYRRPLPRLPFCEEYDGVNLRKTTTISQSIQELIQIQRKAREDVHEEEPKDESLCNALHSDLLQQYHELVGQTRHILNTAKEQHVTDENENEEQMNAGIEIGSEVLPADILVPADNDKGLLSYNCSISLALEYAVESSRLIVKIIQAEEVKDRKAPQIFMDTLVKVSMYNGKNSRKHETGVVRRSQNPVFNYLVYLDNVVEKWIHIMSLRVQLYKKTKFRKICIGEALIWMDDIELSPNKEIKLTENLRDPFL